jgi:hypothetical protein
VSLHDRSLAPLGMLATFALFLAIISLYAKKPVVEYGDVNIVPTSVGAPLIEHRYISGMEAFQVLDWQSCYNLNTASCFKKKVGEGWRERKGVNAM